MAKDWNQTLQEAHDNYTTLIDDTSTADVIYIGKAQPGTATSAALWRIKKINDSSVLFADSNDKFDNIWDNRVSLTYAV